MPQKRSLPRRALTWLVGLVLVVAIVVPLLHVLVLPIQPTQEPPSWHFFKPCVLCHFVSEQAEPIDVD
jgi:hypothetical protein